MSGAPRRHHFVTKAYLDGFLEHETGPSSYRFVGWWRPTTIRGRLAAEHAEFVDGVRGRDLALPSSRY